jgi:hypothetical protein
MRNGQNKRMRGRNRKSQNPMTRVFESNGPDVKIRGTPSHIAEKYIQLARDAQASGDPVGAENYYQHAEHYFRLIAAAQEQFRQNNPQFYRPETEMRGAGDDNFDDGEEGAGQGGQPSFGGEAPFGTREPQPYLPRDSQPYPQQREQYGYAQRPQPQPQSPPADNGGDIDRLPSFITGGQAQGGQPTPNQQGFGQNGHDNNQGGDRFPLHRRRRRHRGPRPELHSGPQGGGDGGRDAPRGED